MRLEMEERFIDDVRVKRSDSTLGNRKSALNKFKKWLEMEELELDDVDDFMVNEFFKWMIVEEDLSELSAYNYLISVKSYFDFVPSLDKDVCDIDTSWINYAPKYDKPSLEEDELSALVGATNSKRGEALLGLMAGTGMRLGEAVDIEMEQVDLDNRCIRDLETIKTDYGERTVYFNRKVRRILREYIKQGYRGKYPSNGSYLFLSDGERSKHISTDRGRVEFKRAVADCDVIDDKVKYEEMSDGRVRCSVTSHILRRSFCQNWIDNGGDIMSLKNQVGWVDLETAKAYLSEDVDKEKVDKFGVKF